MGILWKKLDANNKSNGKIQADQNRYWWVTKLEVKLLPQGITRHTCTSTVLFSVFSMEGSTYFSLRTSSIIVFSQDILRLFHLKVVLTGPREVSHNLHKQNWLMFNSPAPLMAFLSSSQTASASKGCNGTTMGCPYFYKKGEELARVVEDQVAFKTLIKAV